MLLVGQLVQCLLSVLKSNSEHNTCSNSNNKEEKKEEIINYNTKEINYQMSVLETVPLKKKFNKAFFNYLVSQLDELVGEK